MTTSQLEALNRKTRILQRLQAGDTHRAIADDERVTRRFVSICADLAGIPVSRGERNSRTREAAESRNAWDEISRRLDLWNLAHGRTRKAVAA